MFGYEKIMVKMVDWLAMNNDIISEAVMDFALAASKKINMIYIKELIKKDIVTLLIALLKSDKEPLIVKSCKVFAAIGWTELSNKLIEKQLYKDIVALTSKESNTIKRASILALFSIYEKSSIDRLQKVDLASSFDIGINYAMINIKDERFLETFLRSCYEMFSKGDEEHTNFMSMFQAAKGVELLEKIYSFSNQEIRALSDRIQERIEHEFDD